MKIKLRDKTVALVVIGLVALVLAIVQLLATGITGETDSIAHYQIARYAFKYPEFLLDHWGKPLYTILAAPLAQFGYTGAIAFNLICGLAAAWLAFLIAKQLGYRLAWVAIVFTVFTPMYLFIMYSSLTEILFSLVLMAAIYLFASKRFIWSAIVISLIPYVRTEGVMFIVLFIPSLLWMKQYRALPFLVTGFIVFGLAGLPQYDDFFWFFTKMPYSINSAELYGGGSFWVYFRKMDYIVNSPLLILILIGLVILVLDLKNGMRNLRDIRYVTLWLLIIPGAFGFILAQSYLWWKGLGILASFRFMACVLPLGAIMALAGFDWMMGKLRRIRIIYLLFGVFILWLTVSKPFSYGVLPMKPGPNNAVMEELAEWIKASPNHGRKTVYTDPLFPFYMDMDPYDSKKCIKVYTYENINPSTLLKPGELLIWDPQFAGYEGRLSLDSLMNNKQLRLLRIFNPVDTFSVIGGEQYRLAVFMKAPRDTNRTIYREFFSHDFESGFPEDQMKHITDEYSYSGRRCLMLTPGHIFSPALEDKLINLPDTGKISLRASVRVMSPQPIEKGKTLLVISIDNADHQVFSYAATRDSASGSMPGEWFELSMIRPVDRHTPLDGHYKVYVWYTGREKVYVDDLRLEYKMMD